MRLEITTPQTTDPFSFAISPDGRLLAFVALQDGVVRLWVRPLDATVARPLAGTEGASWPFWSPDSQSVGFFANSKLRRIDISGGSPRTLADANHGRGTWSADGTILFTGLTRTLFRVSASGGEAAAVTTLDSEQRLGHWEPFFLPGGRQFLFYSFSSTRETAGIYLGSLDTTVTRRLTVADSPGAYALSSQTPLRGRAVSKLSGTLEDHGWLLFVRQGTLFAQPLDLVHGALTGEPLTIANPVGVPSSTAEAGFSVSPTVLTYRGHGTGRQLVWFDRFGKQLGTLGQPDPTISSPALSPDGQRVAVHRTLQGNTDVWLVDGARFTRLTFEARNDVFPLWSPDGSRIVFDSSRKGHRDLYQMSSSSAGGEMLLLESSEDKVAQDWSLDGRFLLYTSTPPQARRDLWILPLDGDRKPFVFLNTRFDELHGRFSPDGRFIAYVSNESGQHEVYVRPFPGSGRLPGATDTPMAPGEPWQVMVSTAGGMSPDWSWDGKELYYIDPANFTLMAAAITVAGSKIDAGAPVALFETKLAARRGASPTFGRDYDVARDGRFLINVAEDVAPITVVLNWTTGLTQ
jgi:Tol biopolymer transport system component